MFVNPWASEALEGICNALDERDVPPDVRATVLEGARVAFLQDDAGSHENLIAVASKCTKCPLMDHGGYSIPYWNTEDPKVLLISELSPKHWQPEVATFLVNSLKEAGFSSADAALTYLTRCSPKDRQHPNDDEIGNCSTYLYREIEILQPSVIMCLGLTVTKAFLPSDKNLNELRGSVHWLGPWAFIATMSPNQVHYASGLDKKNFLSDLALAHRLCST